ncbi:hypothetical protein LSTR_LSTR010460 [Laodelphax striatellus]|uniref:Uncharacterized protein n=1 Tax=Laodelphax striatellus TaxID=195883 RepID=A0A482WUT4_LAOST|nr:hypothetical protein LSTR_LSTR010460 [Laodelphax striatellus]
MTYQGERLPLVWISSSHNGRFLQTSQQWRFNLLPKKRKMRDGDTALQLVGGGGGAVVGGWGLEWGGRAPLVSSAGGRCPLSGGGPHSCAHQSAAVAYQVLSLGLVLKNHSLETFLSESPMSEQLTIRFNVSMIESNGPHPAVRTSDFLTKTFLVSGYSKPRDN